jgi:hypothetical protein
VGLAKVLFDVLQKAQKIPRPSLASDLRLLLLPMAELLHQLLEKPFDPTSRGIRIALHNLWGGLLKDKEVPHML